LVTVKANGEANEKRDKGLSWLTVRLADALVERDWAGRKGVTGRV